MLSDGNGFVMLGRRQAVDGQLGNNKKKMIPRSRSVESSNFTLEFWADDKKCALVVD